MKGAFLKIKNRVCDFLKGVKERFCGVDWKNIRVQKEDVKLGCGFGLVLLLSTIIKKVVKKK